MAENALIKSLSEKIDLLMKDNRLAHEEARRLRDAEEKLEKENRALKEVIAEREKRIKVLELENALKGSGADTKQAKARINNLMREIDKCIALMNK